MLRSNPVQNFDPAPVAAPEERESDLSDVVGFVRRQWFIIASALGAAVLLALTYLLVAPPQYTAKLQLMIDSRKVQPFAQQAIVSELTLDTTVVDSQVEVLKSDAVGMSVVQKLKLADDPEIARNAGSFFLSTANSVMEAFGSGSAATQSEDELRQRALKHLKRNLTVQRVGRTYVLEVAYRSLDKNKAAAIANELSEAYILDQLKANFDATKRASDWLEGRLTELRDDVERSDRAVQDYKAKYNLVDAGNGRTLTDQQLGDLTTQLVQSRAQVAEAKARLDRISGVDFIEGADTSVSDAINNPVILKVREQYLENTRRAADFAARYGESHAAVVNLRKENEQLRLAGRDELRRIAEAYRSDYEIAKSRLEFLEASLNNIIEAANSDKQAGVSLRTLESSAQSYRRLYDSFLQRFADSTQQQSFPKTEARVITPATRGEKSDPNTLLVLGAAAMAGLMGGVGIAFAREQLDRVLKTSRQVEDDLGVECLGILPRIELKETRQMARELAPAASNQRGPRSLPVELGLLRYVTRAPLSRFAETIRRVKVAAGTTASPDDSVVLGVVSALPGEGKSTVAANLAQLLNSAGNRALLIDADLRHPSLTKHLTPNARAGLVELLNSSVTLDDVVWKDPVTEVDFLPAVLDRPIPHSAELLSSGAMARLLEVLRTRYKYIVLDFPPLAPVVDASAASEFVDKFLLVIEWGQTLPATVADSLASADLIQARMLGAVLNKADLAALKRLEPYNTKGYYNYYYEE